MKVSLNKISKSFYINLDRRQDRRDHIESTLPFACERFPAVDGRSLELNPLVKKTFPNLDKITKAEAACAMSHYMIWKTLLNDDSSDSYLILEDDVVFEKGFTTFWNHGQSVLLPKDYNLIYLGGCQPWNKPQYHKCLERYNDCFNRIKKTDFFQSDSHYWHMNASSYILSKKGAKVLCDFVDQNGFTVSLDHFMIYIINDYNSDSLYHLNPLVARQLHEENDNTSEDLNSDIRKDIDKLEENNKKISYFCPSVLEHKGTTYTLLRTEERFRWKMPDGSRCADYTSFHNLKTIPFYVSHDGWGVNFFEGKSWYSLKINNELFKCKVYIKESLCSDLSLHDLCDKGINKIEDVRIIHDTVSEKDGVLKCLAYCTCFENIKLHPKPKVGHNSKTRPGFCEVDFTNKTIKLLGVIGENKIPAYGSPQKNWMPFKHKGTFYCIYSADPFIYSKAENLKDIYFEPSDLKIKPDIHNATTPIKIGNNTYCMILHSQRADSETHAWSYKKHFLKFEIIDGEIVNLQKEPLSSIPDYAYCSSMFFDDNNLLNVGAGIEDCDYDVFKIKRPEFNSLNVIWQGMGGKTKRPWDDPDQDFIIESDWLLYLLGDKKLNHINDENHSFAQDNSIIIYSDIWPSNTKCLPEHLHQKCKDNNSNIKNYFEKFKDFKNCYLIHLSDEHGCAETSHYKYFKHVFRNIYRDDVANQNVTFFPLGFKDGFTNYAFNVCSKKYTWSFMGQIQGRPTRDAMLSELKKLSGEHFQNYNTGWLASDMIEQSRYKSIMSDSIFVPCPKGNTSVDCFRFCEALEAGSIPIPERGDDYWDKLLGKDHPFYIQANSDWKGMADQLELLLSNTKILDAYNKKVSEWWVNHKFKLRNKFSSIISCSHKNNLDSNIFQEKRKEFQKLSIYNKIEECDNMWEILIDDERLGKYRKPYDWLSYASNLIPQQEIPKEKFFTFNPGNKIAVVSLYTPEISDFGIYSERSIQEYCEHQGYTFYIYRDKLDESLL